MKMFFTAKEVKASVELHLEIFKLVDDNWYKNQSLAKLQDAMEENRLMGFFRDHPAKNVIVSDEGIEIEIPEELMMQVIGLYRKKARLVTSIVKTVLAAANMFAEFIQDFQSELEEVVEKSGFMKPVKVDKQETTSSTESSVNKTE